MGPVDGTCGWDLWVGPVDRTCGWGQWMGCVGGACGWGLWVGPVGGTSGWSCWPTSVCLSLELPVGELAEGMGLLRVPAMPELRGIPVTGFSPTDLDLDSICYK